jgi:hypothetical protein
MFEPIDKELYYFYSNRGWGSGIQKNPSRILGSKKRSAPFNAVESFFWLAQGSERLHPDTDFTIRSSKRDHCCICIVVVLYASVENVNLVLGDGWLSREMGG